MTNLKDDFTAEDLRRTAFEWRVLIESGDPSLDELANFQAWREADPLHADAYDRAISVFDALGTLGREEIDADIYPSPQNNLADVMKSRFPLGLFGSPVRFGALAASVAVAVSTAFFMAKRFETNVPIEIAAPPVIASYETGRGETRSVTLSDGSNVTLGAASALSVSISSDRRQLVLSRGAALFDVSPDASRPFSVEAGGLTATALGTVFAVRNNGGVMRLAVSEGRVEAAHPLMLKDKPSSLISRREVVAGEQIVATQGRGLSSITALPERNFGAWREDKLTYVGATLNELVADANRYSERQITVSEGVRAINDLNVTVTFDGKDIDTMLAIFPDMFPVEVDTSSPDEIVIRRR